MSEQSEEEDALDQMMKGMEAHLDPEQLQSMRELMRHAIAGYAGKGTGDSPIPTDQPTDAGVRMLRRVTRDQYPALRALSAKRERLAFGREYSSQEHERMTYGVSPFDMDEKWIMICEGETLRMWRSWPPNECIFEIVLYKVGGGYETRDAWVAAEWLENPNMTKSYTVALLDYLVQRMLLARAAQFPFPAAVKTPMDRMMFRHSMVGSSFANGEP